MTANECVLAWFRLDLRLADNPALAAAAASGLPVIPIFIWPEEEDFPATTGAASRWWLHHSLSALSESLLACGSRLILRCGPAAKALPALAAETGASRIFCNRIYDSSSLSHESHLAAELRTHGVSLETFNGSLLFEPGSIRTSSGNSFQVFTPFGSACWNRRDTLRTPLAPPRSLHPPARWPSSPPVAGLYLLPQIDWAAGLRAAWTPGESAALARLRAFARSSLANYSSERDRPDRDGTSRLSPHLHFGEISPLQIWHAVAGRTGSESFLRQLLWREFAGHFFAEHPQTAREPWNPRFRTFPSRRNSRRLAAWQRGRTGYPFVDAAMRQLWTTGWMHNRARMIVASFLVKHLLIPWQDGAAWFLDTLVDADLANNTMGWQWVAGCGVDPAPFFRVFNPIVQGEKFDPAGDYVRRWIPELRELPSEWIHQPWAAPPLVLASAGVRLGETYPHPIVEHAAARKAALNAFAEMKASSSGR